MYDPVGADTGREWVRIHNEGTEGVDVKNFRLLEAGVHHKLKTIQGGTTLAPGAEAIVADNAETFLSEQSGYTGVLFDSSFSLSNTGETLVLKNSKGEIEDTYSYTASVKKPEPKKETLPRTSQKSSLPSAAASSTAAGNMSAIVTWEDSQRRSGVGMLAWGTGLLSVIALGIAGVLFAKQERIREEETSDSGEAFKLIDN